MHNTCLYRYKGQTKQQLASFPAACSLESNIAGPFLHELASSWCSSRSDNCPLQLHNWIMLLDSTSGAVQKALFSSSISELWSPRVLLEFLTQLMCGRSSWGRRTWLNFQWPCCCWLRHWWCWRQLVWSKPAGWWTISTLLTGARKRSAS